MWVKKRPTVPEYFTGKNIFITGATGFIGKVLIEKLLRSCPEVGTLYILIREKKGKSPEERIKAITDLALFDILKKEHPENLNKIVPIIGDVMELNLGISPEDRKTLIQNVHIVYHIAASVRFDDGLRDAILMNTRGTREVVTLAKELVHLQVLMHFSTAYCNTTDRTVVEEKIYPCPADWKTSIQLAEQADSHILDIMTHKYTDDFPNTYTFTKLLGEHVVKDLCEDRIPAVIFRPSIVISTMTDPFPGWIDNFNGPVGILVASGKGVMRTIYANPNIKADYVPCDSVVKGVIMATWKKALEQGPDQHKISVYQVSSYNVQQITVGQLVNLGKVICWELPLNDIIWYPNGTVTPCWYENYLKLIFYQLLPGLFVDALLVLLGKKPMLIKVHRKIFIANCALSYFLRYQWAFLNDNLLSLENYLDESDLAAFSYQRDHELTDPYRFFKNGLMGGRRYLLKEPDSTFEGAVRHSRRMWIIMQAFNFVWYIVGFVILYQLIIIIGNSDVLCNYFSRL